MATSANSNMRTLRSLLLPSVECLLVEAPAVSSHRAGASRLDVIPDLDRGVGERSASRVGS